MLRRDDYRWALELHLLPFFARHRLAEITVEEIDRYKAAKLREGRLAPNAINKTIVRLAQVLEVGVEYGRLDRNPAKGKRRRVKGTEPRRSWVEPEQLGALLDAAIPTCARSWRPWPGPAFGSVRRRRSTGATSTSPPERSPSASQDGGWRGPRGGPVGGAPRGAGNLAGGDPRTGQGDPVFVSRARDGCHARQTPRNVQARLKTAVKAANVRLAELGIQPISERVTPHSLRRCYASLRAALRDDPVYIAAELGHRDARFTFRVYQRAAKRREKLSGVYLEAFDRALAWAEIGRPTENVSDGNVPDAERAHRPTGAQTNLRHRAGDLDQTASSSL